VRPRASGGPFPIAWLGEPPSSPGAVEGVPPAPADSRPEPAPAPETPPASPAPAPSAGRIPLAPDPPAPSDSTPPTVPASARSSAEPTPAALPADESPVDVAAGRPAGGAAADEPAPPRSGPFGEDEVDRVAEPLSPPRPAYPRSERLLGLEADVVLSLVVGADGRVEAAEVVESAGERFDRASLDAARRARFRPARLGGEAVSSRVIYTVHYRLDG